MSKKLSRIEKYGRRKPIEPLEEDYDLLLDDEKMPPRKVLHPSNKGKLTQIFYNTLIILFILLMVGLLLWGRKFNV